RFLRPPAEERHGRFYMATERAFEATLRLYDRSLQAVLRVPRTTLFASAVLLVVTGWLFVVIPKGFLPSEDIGQLFAFTEGAQGISFDARRQHQQEPARLTLDEPDVAGFSSSVGAGGPNASGNSGRLFMRLKPRAERTHSAEQLIEILRPKYAKVPGIRAF